MSIQIHVDSCPEASHALEEAYCYGAEIGRGDEVSVTDIQGSSLPGTQEGSRGLHVGMSFCVSAHCFTGDWFVTL